MCFNGAERNDWWLEVVLQLLGRARRTAGSYTALSHALMPRNSVLVDVVSPSLMLSAASHCLG